MKTIVILGAGPAGIALALQLKRKLGPGAEVVVLEKAPRIGGISASFEHKGLYLDYGSHRLHPVLNTQVLQDIQSLLGPDLRLRPRNGRIRLSGRYVKFPPNPIDCLRHLPSPFTRGLVFDILQKPFRKSSRAPASFADALLQGLGSTICHHFYFPYARKLWGLAPEDISADQARRRVAAGHIGKLIGKVFSPTRAMQKVFYYPRRGFGQITEAMAREFEKLGGKILLSQAVSEISLTDNQPLQLAYSRAVEASAPSHPSQNTEKSTLSADYIFSTIPINRLLDYLNPPPPAEVQTAGRKVRYRAMIFCYLILNTDRFSPHDAHYFPENDVVFSRLSEPKNYSGTQKPRGRTGLCAEIPCEKGGRLWNTTEADLIGRVIHDLSCCDLPLPGPLETAFTRRLSHVYPIYDLNYARHLRTIRNHIEHRDRIISLGRQGLFIHNNVHHVLDMARAAADCLQTDYRWDANRWRAHINTFQTTTVED